MEIERLCMLFFGLFITVYVQRTAGQSSVLGKACTVPGNCTGVVNATCGAASHTCDCLPAFKVSGKACVRKGLGDNCTNSTNCAAVKLSICDTNQKCACPATHKEVGGKCQAKVIGAACSDANATTVCSVAKSTCASSTNKCACEAGYYHLNDQCLKVIGATCSASNATLCSTVKSTCASSTHKCAREAGYTDVNNQCLQVLGSACAAGNASIACKTPNAECNATRKQCACKAGFVMEDVACQKALGKTCAAATECVSNAVCDTTKKCACNDGYENANGLCAPSSAEENRLASSILVASLLLTILELF